MDRIVETGTLIILKLVLGPFQTNGYILVCPQTGDSLVVDAPAEGERILQALQGTKPRYIIMTHDHLDHTQALAQVAGSLAVPVAVHRADADGLPVRPEVFVSDGETLTLGRTQVRIIHTPGHTPGSLCLSIGDQLLAGDTLFPGGPGRTGSPAAFRQIMGSIRDRLLGLPDETAVHPGHGDSTTIGRERPAIEAFLARSHPEELHGDVLWEAG